MADHWTEGYNAGLQGIPYSGNPYEGKQGSTAWAFGCGEGLKERNRKSFQDIIANLRES
jgi:hypothetical protein